MLNKPRALIVDDEPDNVRLLATIFKERYAIRVANRGELALAAVEAERPDVVLLDIGLPDMDGYEVCRRIRGLGPGHDMPVIFISGRTSLVDKVTSFGAGGVDYIEKPFHADEVLARVDTHMRLFRRQQADNVKADALEQLLRERDALLEERRRLTAMVVHDLGSPLMVVSHYLDALTEGGDVADGLDLATASIDMIRRLTKDAIVVSQLESARVPLHIELHRMGDVVSSGIAMARAQVAEVQVDTDADIWCDHALIDRVISNLVNNGADHGELPLSLNSQRIEGGVRISVTDSGVGVPPDRSSAIFEDFASSSGYGRGLGLSFCRHAVLAHDGAIGVDGSEFWFTLPDPN